MRIKLFVTIILMLVLFANFCSSEDLIASTKKDTFFEDKMIRIHNDVLGGLYLSIGNIGYTFGIFGNTNDFENIIKIDKQASNYFNQFTFYDNMSTVFSITSFISLGVVEYVAYRDNLQNIFNSTFTTSLFIGSVVGLLVGSYFYEVAQNNLFNSVWEYNQNVYNSR
jgi:hypothetical protein